MESTVIEYMVNCLSYPEMHQATATEIFEDIFNERSGTVYHAGMQVFNTWK